MIPHLLIQMRNGGVRPSVAFARRFSASPLQLNQTRLLSSGTPNRRTRPAPTSMSRPTLQEAESRFEGEAVEFITIDSTIRMKNAALGVTLLGFCFGVAWYSMNAVGQSGADDSDPLSVLKQEAAAAQVQQDRQHADEAKSADMVRQFQAGEYDPDKLDDEESEPVKKSRWWKFW
jgi:hypothetical protein